MLQGLIKNELQVEDSGRWSPQKSRVPLQQTAHFWRSTDHMPYGLCSTPTDTQCHSRRSLITRCFIRKDATATAFAASRDKALQRAGGRLQHFATFVFFNMCCWPGTLCLYIKRPGRPSGSMLWLSMTFLYIYLSNWLLTVGFSLWFVRLCQAVGFVCVTKSLTKQPPLVSNVLKIQKHTLSVRVSLIRGCYLGPFCTSPSSTLRCRASYNNIISLFLKKFRKKRAFWLISFQNKGLRILLLWYHEPYPHTHLPCLPLFLGLCWGFPNFTLKIYRSLLNSIIIQKISEAGSAALELQISAHRLFFFCMQTLQSSGADPTVIWPWFTDHLALMLQSSRADAAEPEPEIYRNRYRDYLDYVTVD